MIFRLAATLAGAYLVGSIPVGLLVGRAKGVDIRKHGSGNIGATNVGRVLGRKFGILVFVLDVTKGALCTGLSGSLGPPAIIGNESYRDIFWLTAAIGAVVGNIASIYMSFKGGKGVGTSLGALFGIYPYLTFPSVLAALIWLIVVSVSKYVSLASMVATAAMPFLFVALSLAFDWGVRAHLSLLLLCVVLVVLVLLRHKDNIRRLLAGTENRVGSAHPISRQE